MTPQLPIASEMARVPTASVAALTAAVALLCAGAGFLAAALGLSPPLVAVCVAAAGTTLIVVPLVAWHTDDASEQTRDDRLRELRELLDSSASEAESRTLLMRHAQRLAPEAGIAVLSRIDSEERIEPILGEQVADTPLAALPVRPLTPEACLSLRLGRPYDRALAGDAIATCEVCGAMVGDVTCRPLQAVGRTIGALLVVTAEPIEPLQRDELGRAAAITAPVLVLQRSLDIAERLAAQDPLTGLPNRRAAEDTLRRLSAQAGRTVSPVAAVVVDLDRFHSVNDRFGHTQGDEAIVAVGRILAESVRASDFVGRYGGAQFIVLAPDTDRRGGTELAEKLRRAIERLALPGVGRVTASFGVAALPEDALEGETLVRRAGHALSIAKALGRNRVHGAESRRLPGP